MSALDSYKALEALHSIEDKIRAASREALAEHGQALRQAGLIDELAHLRRALILDEIRAIATRVMDRQVAGVSVQVGASS